MAEVTSHRDLAARREMARLMRKFARGGMSVSEFESATDRLAERDSVASEAQLYTWYFYDDFRTENLSGAWRLTPEAIRDWAKWVLFLMQSDEEYSGPSFTPSLVGCYTRLAVSAVSFLLSRVCEWPRLIAFVAGYFLSERWLLDVFGQLTWKKQSDPEPYWPFGSPESFQRAISLANPFAV